ncbi:MAG: substrate-binding domain-containing protein [Kiritimatiellia bacterium]
MQMEKRKWVAPNVRLTAVLRARLADSRPGDALGTEVALAQEFGVSRMTARKAVEVLVAEGLVVRRAGVGLFVREPEKGPKGVRFLAGNLLWDSAIRVAAAFRHEAEAAGLEVEMRDAGGDAVRLKAELAALPSAGVSGAVVFSIHEPALTAAMSGLAASGFPLVVVDEAFAAKSGVIGVVSDNAVGGRLAAERLLHAGCRELAFIGDYEADTVRTRWAGFRQFAEEQGVRPVRIELNAADRLGDWTHAIHESTRRLLKRKVRPTGLFCSCDAVARHVLRALEAHGVNVPRDMSLIGFDDDPIAEWTSPALTTVRQDFAALGTVAAQALVARCTGKAVAAETISVPVTLIVRDTVATPRFSSQRRVRMSSQ